MRNVACMSRYELVVPDRPQFASGKAVNAVIMLAARRLDDAAARLARIAAVAASRHDDDCAGRCRDTAMAQADVDNAAAKTEEDLADVQRELDETDATLTLTAIR